MKRHDSPSMLMFVASLLKQRGSEDVHAIKLGRKLQERFTKAQPVTH
jgi:hypothetical protein